MNFNCLLHLFFNHSSFPFASTSCVLLSGTIRKKYASVVIAVTLRRPQTPRSPHAIQNTRRELANSVHQPLHHLTRWQPPPIVLVSPWMSTCHGTDYRLCLCRDSSARSRWVQGNTLQERRHQDREGRATPGHPRNDPRAHELSLETLVSILSPNPVAV